jgi:hypothetical protein
VPYTEIKISSITDLDQSLKLQAVFGLIEIGSSKLVVFNVYYPSISSCPAGHQPIFSSLLDFHS